MRRLAVRGIIEREGKLLLVKSAVHGDWKFPGGGVKPRETPEAALRREVMEETGYDIVSSIRLAGKTLERAAGRELPHSLFVMESRYFWAVVGPVAGQTSLDDYEEELGFAAQWVSPSVALGENKELFESTQRPHPPWLERELRVLEYLVNLRYGR